MAEVPDRGVWKLAGTDFQRTEDSFGRTPNEAGQRPALPSKMPFTALNVGAT
jgi:hypothetical protein